MKTVRTILLILAIMATGAVFGLCSHLLMIQPPQAPEPVHVHISNITEIQEQLRDAGYYHGAIDSKWGPQTDRAYCDYCAGKSFKKGSGL